MKLFPVLCCAVLAAMLISPAVYAADAMGAAEIKLLNTIFTGYIGYALGLALAAMGAYTIAMGNMKGGVLLIVVGVLITLLPMVFNAMHSLVCPAVSALFGGKCGG